MNCPKCGKACTPRPKEIMCLCMAKHFACLPCKTRYADWGDKIDQHPMDELDIQLFSFKF